MFPVSKYITTVDSILDLYTDFDIGVAYIIVYLYNPLHIALYTYIISIKGVSRCVWPSSTGLEISDAWLEELRDSFPPGVGRVPHARVEKAGSKGRQAAYTI